MAHANAGMVISICTTPQPADLDQTGFEALTYVPIGGVGTLGETGTQTNILTYDTLDTTVTQKDKGNENAGDPAVECAHDYNDAGQVALRAAALTGDKYAVKIEHNDGGTGFTNTIRYQRGLVLEPTHPNGGSEDFQLDVFTLALVQKELTVLKAAV